MHRSLTGESTECSGVIGCPAETQAYKCVRTVDSFPCTSATFTSFEKLLCTYSNKHHRGTKSKTISSLWAFPHFLGLRTAHIICVQKKAADTLSCQIPPSGKWWLYPKVLHSITSLAGQQWILLPLMRQPTSSSLPWFSWPAQRGVMFIVLMPQYCYLNHRVASSWLQKTFCKK